MTEPTDEQVLNDPEIRSWFQAATERKEAGLNAASTAMNSSDFDSGFKKSTTENTSKAPENTAPTATPTPSRDKISETSAKTFAALLNTTQDTLLNMVMSFKMKRKFGDHEELLESIIDKPDSELPEQHVSLRKRYLKYLEKDEKIRAAIPFTDKEKQSVSELMKEYYTITGQELSPNMIIAASVVEVMTKRVNRIFFDLK